MLGHTYGSCSKPINRMEVSMLWFSREFNNAAVWC